MSRFNLFPFAGNCSCGFLLSKTSACVCLCLFIQQHRSWLFQVIKSLPLHQVLQHSCIDASVRVGCFLQFCPLFNVLYFIQQSCWTPLPFAPVWTNPAQSELSLSGKEQDRAALCPHYSLPRGPQCLQDKWCSGWLEQITADTVALEAWSWRALVYIQDIRKVEKSQCSN